MSPQFLLNHSVNIPIKTSLVSSGVVSDILFMKDGVSQSISHTTSIINNLQNLYSLIFTPNSAGLWFIIIGGEIVFSFEVVSKLSSDILLDVLDVSIGSWSWDKSLGTLTLHRVDGSTLSEYNIIDTNLISSRELVI